MIKATYINAFCALCVVNVLYADQSHSASPSSANITFYKNGALIQQGQTLSLSSGRHTMHLGGVAHSIIKESLMLALSAPNKDATIIESDFSKSTHDNSYVLNLLVNSNVHEPKSYVSLTYMLHNMSWKPHYAIQFTSGFQQLTFNGWVDITNNSGLTLKNAHVQFEDADLPTIQASNADKSTLYKAKSYLYKELLNIKDQETKRLNWVSSSSLKAKQDYRIFVGGRYLDDMDSKRALPVVETWISFHNIASNSLGYDLPEGFVVLYYQDAQGQLEVLGNTSLKHIPAGQEVSVRVPTAQYDKYERTAKKNISRIEAELEQNQYRTLNDTHMTEANYCLNLKNTSNEATTIRVVLDLPQGLNDWKIIRETAPHQKKDDNTVYWNIGVPANSHVQLKYQLMFIKAQ